MSETLSTKTSAPSGKNGAAAKSGSARLNLPTGVLVATTSYLGFCGPENGPWHSDAQTVTELLAKHELSSASPSLYIRASAGLDQVRMTLTDTSHQKHELNKYGGDGGDARTLDAQRMKNILQISVWGTNHWDTPRIGKIMFTYTAESKLQPDVFGREGEIPLGSCDANGAVLLGFTGNSGTMVDGLCFLFADLPH